MLGDLVKDSKNPVMKWVYYGLIMLIVVVICIVVIKIIQASKAGATAAGDILGQQIVQAQTGVEPTRQIVCRAVAKDCRDAMTLLVFTNFVIHVSNDDMVNALNRLVTPQEAMLMSSYFQQDNGFSLAAHVKVRNIATTAFTGQDRVKPEILNALT